MTDQAVKELEKMGIKQPIHKAWDRCDCEDCTSYKLGLKIFQKGRDKAIRETLDYFDQFLASLKGEFWNDKRTFTGDKQKTSLALDFTKEITDRMWIEFRRELLKEAKR